MNTKVKLIAIAKNESAYFPEWIFHHLYFGFDEIEILVNRTTDNSAQMLNLLCTEFTQVSWRSVDWVDLADHAVAAHIQHIAYAESFGRNRDNFSHIMFLDIDEFWTPSNFEDSIHSFLTKIGSAGSVYFEWLTESGHNEAYSHLKNDHSYNLSRLGKSIINTQANIKSLDIHKPRHATGDETVLADGQPYKSAESEGLNHQFIARELSSLKTYYVIHRMSRSEREYLSIIFRGNPAGKSSFKLNRATGYEKQSSETITISFPENAWMKYENARNTFFNSTHLQHELSIAQSFVSSRADLALNALPDALAQDEENIKPLLNGLTDESVIKLVKNLKNN